MRLYNKGKNRLLILLLMLIVLCIGVGYAILTQQLTINNTVFYDSMKWDVGFSSVLDGNGSVKTLSDISSDKKTITLTCDVGASTSSETCIVNATITNASTFNVMLSGNPTITYNDTYISSVDVIWLKSFDEPQQFDGINAGNSEDVQIKIITRELTIDMLPSTGVDIPITVSMDFIEADGNEKTLVSSIGQEITIGDDKFNIISEDKTTVTMLAQYNIGLNYRQSTSLRDVTFANSNGWEYAPGPKEIDIQQFDGEVKTYINEYVNYLRTTTGDTSITGDLITLRELKSLGCTISDDYSYTSGLTCSNSEYKTWLVNSQYWWTRSASSSSPISVWMMNYFGNLSTSSYNDSMGGNGVRPTITVSKEMLRNLS